MVKFAFDTCAIKHFTQSLGSRTFILFSSSLMYQNCCLMLQSAYEITIITSHAIQGLTTRHCAIQFCCIKYFSKRIDNFALIFIKQKLHFYSSISELLGTAKIACKKAYCLILISFYFYRINIKIIKQRLKKPGCQSIFPVLCTVNEMRHNSASQIC